MVDFRPAPSARSSRIPLPQRGGGAGEAIARGGQQVGEALFGAAMQDRQLDERHVQIDHDLDMAELERARQATIADAAGRIAETKGALTIRAEELRATSKPGAVGHSDAYAAEVDKAMSEFSATLGSDPEVLRRFEPIVRGTRTELTTREQAWSIGEFGKHQGAQWGKFVEAEKVDLQAAPTLEKLQGFIDKTTDLIEGMGVTGNLRAQMLDATHREGVTTVLDAQMAGGNQAAVREILKKGSLDPFLTAEIKDRYYDEADRADQRAAVAAEREAAEQVRAARETVKTVQALMDGGAVPTPAQMDSLRAAQKLLPPSEQVEVAAIDTQVAVNRATTGVPAAGIRAERDRLRAKVNAGQASQTEQMMVAAYDKRLDAAEGDEADELKNLMGEGTAGRIAGVERLQGMDPASRAAIADRAAPGMGAVAVLPAQLYRRMAIEGAEIRRAQKDLVPEKEAIAAFRQNVGSVGTMLGEQYDDKMAVAMDLYAHDVSRRPQKGFNARLFWQYTNIAFGATKREDGSFQGGLGTVNGVRTVLPDNLSQAEMLSTIARTDWSAARDRSGKPVAKAFITSQMAPVLIDESPTMSVYHMRDRAGQPLLGPNGVPLEFKVPNRVRR